MSFYDTILKGLYGNQLKNVSNINRYYEIYEGEQDWATSPNLDYKPTKKITNYIKKLIDDRARFMFAREPFIDVRQKEGDEKGNTKYKDEAQEKEDLLHKILKGNYFHSKLIKARKDCSIGGRVAIKLWAKKEKGLKIIFNPAQEFFAEYNIDDVDELEKITFLYFMNDGSIRDDQRVKKQEWEMINGSCFLNEGIYNGRGELIKVLETDYNTRLDFIPVVIIRNGGLTGETEGLSDVKRLWPSQDSYNKLTSDDMDALKFQMFGQDVATDASEESLESMVKAPGALVDLQTDMAQSSQGRQAKMERLESNFSYSEKFQDTRNNIKNDMHDIMSVPNVSLEQLKGLMTSGKSMRALYWELIMACDEDWIEWGAAIEQMVGYIFKMIDVYNLYDARKIARYETTLDIQYTYPIQEDEIEAKEMDLEEVVAEVRSRDSYIDKWSEVENVEAEVEQIILEKQMFQDNYTQDLNLDIRGEGNET